MDFYTKLIFPIGRYKESMSGNCTLYKEAEKVDWMLNLKIGDMMHIKPIYTTWNK